MSEQQIVTRPTAFLAARTEIDVPDTLDDARMMLNGVGTAMMAGHWGTAAIVYAYAERGESHFAASDEKSPDAPMSFAEFAKLGIRGLTSRDTVRKYRTAWEHAVGQGWVPAAEPGARIVLPDQDWKDVGWSNDELRMRGLLEEDITVVVNMREHEALIAWAKERDLFVRVDRATEWGNPFVLGEDKDGDRGTVVDAYRQHYLPHKPSLLTRIEELEGKALGCWCAPELCHADVLADYCEE